MTEAITIPSTPTLRGADIEELIQVLQEQQGRAVDVVVYPKKFIQVHGDQFQLSDIPGQVETDADGLPVGVTDVNGLYRTTRIGDEGLSDATGIPLRFLRMCRTEHRDLYEANVQKLLHARDEAVLLRLLTSNVGPGVIRAVLSQKYRTIDNFDAVLALMSGLTEAGIKDPVIQCDLTERRMVVRVTVPEIAALAPKLLEGYRSPFDGTDVGRGWTPDRLARISQREGQAMDPKTIFAGLVFTNSEVGFGAWLVGPELTVQVCGNGLRVTADAKRKIHVGAQLEEGVQWSDATRKANLQLITNQTKDAVKEFLSPKFLKKKITELEADAGIPVEDGVAVITNVSKQLGFTSDQAALIMSHFIRGGQTTAGGVMQAITSAAEVVRDGDQAFDMASKAVGSLRLVRELVGAGR